MFLPSKTFSGTENLKKIYKNYLLNFLCFTQININSFIYCIIIIILYCNINKQNKSVHTRHINHISNKRSAF